MGIIPENLSKVIPYLDDTSCDDKVAYLSESNEWVLGFKNASVSTATSFRGTYGGYDPSIPLLIDVSIWEVLKLLY